MIDTPKVATEEEIRSRKRECFFPNCKHKAFFRGWDGWRWCLKHWFREIKLSDNKWFYFKTTKLF